MVRASDGGCHCLIVSALWGSPTMEVCATPMMADWVNAPAAGPADNPGSYESSLARTMTVVRPTTMRTTVNTALGRPSPLRPEKNCGPSLYPSA
jgi:hypothetical protein